MQVDCPRTVAAQVLLDRLSKGGYVERHLDRALDRAQFSPEDAALCQELAYGCVRWQATLDWLITRQTSRPQQRPVLQVILRLGFYQLFWLNRIPAHAAVHATVEATKRLRYAEQTGFINAVLRNALREHDAIARELGELQTSQPALGWSHPDWLVQRWQARYGMDDTLRLLAWNNAAAKVYARINTLKADPGKLLEYWRTDDVRYDFVFKDWLEENLVFELKNFPPVEHLRSFQNGLFYIQDPSTLFAVDLLAPKPGERVLDLCAAPGGKTTYIAQRMKNEGTVVACDNAPDRLALLKENCARLGADCVEILSAHAVQPDTTPPFDRVLLDAPCSNTGVLRRRVDLRWRVTEAEFDRLRATQAMLLRRAAAFVKPGGVLVYSTCSLEPEENVTVVEEFLRDNPGFTLDEAGDVLPMRDGFDGAYAARLVKAT